MKPRFVLLTPKRTDEAGRFCHLQNLALHGPNGAQDQTKRAVSENAKTLGFNNAEWE